MEHRKKVSFTLLKKYLVVSLHKLFCLIIFSVTCIELQAQKQDSTIIPSIRMLYDKTNKG